MKLRLRYLIPALVALGAVLLFARNHQAALVEEDGRFDRELDRLDKLDSALNQDVLKARSHLLSNYDSFAEQIASLRLTAAGLSSLCDDGALPGQRPLRDKIAEFTQLVAQKEQLVESFASENAVLNNSLRYLPVASMGLLASLPANEEGEALKTPVNRLMQQVFVHSLLSGDEQELPIRQSLAQLAEWREQHRQDPQAVAVATVAAHVASIIRHKPKVEALTREIVSIPTAACTAQLLDLREDQLVSVAHKAAILEHVLEATCALLVLGIGYTIYALAVANRSLERRVEERTRALQAEAGEHRRTAEERDRFFAASLDLLIISGTDGSCRRVNPAVERVLGWTPEESLSRPFLEFIHPEDRALLMEKMQQAVTGNGVTDIEVRCLCRDGAFRWIAWTTSPVGPEGLFFSSGRDVTERKRTEKDMDRLNKELQATSHQAGMAEVATSVLHNVGNVLNSVNISATLVAESIKKSKITSLGRAVGLLEQHASDLAVYLTSDPQGRNLGAYLGQLHQRLNDEQRTVLCEVDSLRQNIDHIKDIVSMQQEYAKVSGVTELLKITDVVEESLRMNESALVRHGVSVERDYQEVPPVVIQKHKAIQILVNLICNAKNACDEAGRPDKRLTVRVANGDGRIKISVSDNGVGIPPENLTRIFNHGFTTRKGGHGFGLHSGALAATEMRGSLGVHSDGPGRGATFILELPV